MEPKDPGKLFSEANRNLAKAVLILGFKALDSIQQVGTQTQELVQELVKEAQADMAANKVKEEEAKNSENEPPRDINIEVSINEEKISVEPNEVSKNDAENLQESESVESSKSVREKIVEPESNTIENNNDKRARTKKPQPNESKK